MVKICKKYKYECDYCDKTLDGISCIFILYNDLGYNETEQESHYCSKNCIKSMIKILENKYDKEEYENFSEYHQLNKYLIENY